MSSVNQYEEFRESIHKAVNELVEEAMTPKVLLPLSLVMQIREMLYTLGDTSTWNNYPNTETIANDCFQLFVDLNEALPEGVRR